MSELQPTWIAATVGDLFETVGGGTPPTAVPEYWQGTIPWISSADIDDAHHMSISRFISTDAIKDSATNLVPAGSLIVVTRVGLGKVSVAEVPLCFSQDHQALLINPEHFDTKYVLYFMSQAVKEFKHISRGTTISGVTKKQLLETRFTLPPRPEQGRIVAEIEKQFTRLDAAMAALKRVQANLKRYRASVLKAACEGRLVPTEAELARKECRDYEPSDKLLQRILRERRARWEADTLAKMHASGKPPTDDHWKQKYKEPTAPDTSNLPELPEGWCWASVEQISTKVVDEVHQKPNYVSEGIPFITVKNLTAGPGISFEHTNFISPEDHAEFIRRADPGLGDILVSKDGTLGTIRAVRSDETFSIFVSVAMIKPVILETSDFLELALTSPQVQIQMVPKGSGLQHIHLEDLREDCVPLAPQSEQNRIVAECSRLLTLMDATERTVKRNIARGASVRSSILRLAFTGQLVPQDPNDEPASVLVERIRGELQNAMAPKVRRRKRLTSDLAQVG